MSIPSTGILLIPLGLIIMFLPWRYCLIGLVVFAMMPAAAVVNVGHLGLQPGYYLSILLIGRTAVEIMVNRFTFNSFVLGRMQPLFYFLIVALVVLFIALSFFQGQVETLGGAAGYKSGLTQPFHLQRENFTQLAYLILNICLVYVLAHQGAQRPIDVLLKEWDVALVCGLCFAAAVSLWQFSSFYAGVDFPGDFFYSNAGYNRADSQEMVGLLRLNGPFEEPSSLGYTFTGYLLFAWLRYRLHPSAFSVGLIAASIFCMLASTSTTAYLGGALFGCVVLYDVMAGRVHLLTRDYKFSSGQLAAIGIVCIGILAGSIIVAKNWSAIHIILQNILFHKTQSTSFQQRSYADLLAMRIIVETYGIGVGLGSHKPNSLLMTLLSNTGVVGFAVFSAWIYTLLRPVKAAVDPGRLKALRRAIQPFQWGLLGLILIHIFSNPNLSFISLWAQMGGIVALQASLRRSVAVERRSYSAAAPEAYLAGHQIPA